MPYVSERCDHGLGSWLPPAEEVSHLAHNYTIVHRNRMHHTAPANAYAYYADRVTARVDRRAESRRRFETYAEEWMTRTAHLSVLSKRVMHPSYQRIIGLGSAALPLILNQLLSQPDHWFWALRSISGEDPVRPEDVGKFDAMRDAWVEWGRNRGLIG